MCLCKVHYNLNVDIMFQFWVLHVWFKSVGKIKLKWKIESNILRFPKKLRNWKRNLLKKCPAVILVYSFKYVQNFFLNRYGHEFGNT